MARKKVRLAYIENDTARRVTYKKRVKGIVKKTRELSVLCGVDACVVVYGPYEKSPVVWPSSEPEARRILMDFKRKPEMDQSQRKFTQLTFLKQSVVKAQERLMKLQRRNREFEIENLMVDILSGRITLGQAPLRDMGDLVWVIDDKIRSIQHRIGVLNGTPKDNIDLTGGFFASNPNGFSEGGICTGITIPYGYHYHPYLYHVGNNVGEMEVGPSHGFMNGYNEWQFGGSSSRQ